jgi:hypothetical protein
MTRRAELLILTAAGLTTATLMLTAKAIVAAALYVTGHMP